MGPPIVRDATTEDAEACARLYEPFARRTVASFEESPPTAAEMAERIARSRKAHAWVVAEDSGTLLGYAYGGTHRPRSAYRWTTEVSAYVAAPAQGRGVGRALYTHLLRVLEERDYRLAVACVALPNEPSIGLHESLGFQQVGRFSGIGWKFGRWHDVLWFQRALGPGTGAPA